MKTMEIHVPPSQATLVVLLGASCWPKAQGIFPASEAFGRAFSDFKQYLLDQSKFGLHEENLYTCFNNDKSPDILLEEISNFLQNRKATMQEAGRPAENLLFYYVGHGHFVARSREYYLAMPYTSQKRADQTGLLMSSVVETLIEDTRHFRRLFILDCCYAASAQLALLSQSGGTAQEAIQQTKTLIQERAGKTPVKVGTTLFCSSGKDEQSYLLPDRSYPAFSKVLLQALSTGDIHTDTPYLSVRDIYSLTTVLIEAMPPIEAGCNVPTPEIHSPDHNGTVEWMPLFPNLAAIKPSIKEKKRSSTPNISFQEKYSFEIFHPPAHIAVYKGPHQDWGEAPQVDVFFGRVKELDQLKQWIVQEQCKLVAIVGMGGIGKTELSVTLGQGGIGKTKLSAKLAQGIQEHFEYVIWRNLLTSRKVTDILEDWIKFLSNQQEINIPPILDEQVLRLLPYLRQHRCLLILDNVETVLRAGQYSEGHEGYGLLFRQIAEAPHQSCLLLNSRETPPEIAKLKRETSPIRSLELSGLGHTDSKKIFAGIGKFLGSEKEWKTLNALYRGNPFVLKLVAQHIRAVYFKHIGKKEIGDISAFLNKSKLFFNDLHELLDWHFGRLSDLHREIVYWLAVHGEPMSLSDLEEAILLPLAKGEIPSTVQSLQDLLPLERSSFHFTLQPVLMEYVIIRFIEHIVDEISTGKIALVHNYALLEAVAKDYVRDNQRRVILQPLINSLTEALGENGCEESLKQLLPLLHNTSSLHTGYAAGNILNLLIHLKADLRGSDFSRLSIRQAYLQGVTLSDMNFSYANLKKCIFTESFGNVLSVAFSPDGTLLAAGMGAGAGNGEIWVIHVSDSELLQICKGHVGWVWSVAFSPDGKTIASGGNDGTVRLWRTATGEMSQVISEHKGAVRSVVFSPNGQVLASGGEDRTVHLRSIDTGELKISSLHDGRIWSIAFHSNGEIFASGSDDGMVRLWTTSSIDQPFKTLRLPMNSKVWAVTFSPKGNILASGSEDTLVRLWDADTGTILKVMERHTGWVRALNFSPDGTMLASSGEETIIYLWDVQTGLSRLVEGHSGWVRTVHFSPDGETLVSGSDDLSLRLWDVKTGYQLKKWQGYNDSVRSVVFSPDGKLLASGGDDQMLRLWSVKTGQCLKTLQEGTGQVWSVAFSPDGKLLASSGDDQMLRLWSVKTGQCLKTLRGHRNSVRSVTFDSGGDRLGSGSLDKAVSVWDLGTNQHVKMPDSHTDRVRCVAFSPTGMLLASGGDDRIIRMWNLKTGEVKQFSGHSDRIQTVNFSSTGILLATAGNDAKIRLWNVETGEYFVLHDHTKTIWSVAFSRSGKLLASGSDDKTVRLWNVETGKCLHVLEHTGIVLSVAFDPNPGKNILACGSDHGTITLWNAQTATRLQTLKSDTPYKDMNITGVKGLTEDQKTALRALGAIDD